MLSALKKRRLTEPPEKVPQKSESIYMRPKSQKKDKKIRQNPLKVLNFAQ